MTKNVGSNKQTETLGELTTAAASCTSCGGDTNILTLLAKPEAILAWLKVGVFISLWLLIGLYLTGKLSLDALVLILPLVRKLL